MFTQPWPAAPSDRRRDHPFFYTYRADRARRTLRGIEQQVTKAENAVAYKTPVKRNRYVRLTGATKSVNRALEAKNRALAGIKGDVTERWQPKDQARSDPTRAGTPVDGPVPAGEPASVEQVTPQEGHGHGDVRCDLQTVRVPRRPKAAIGTVLPPPGERGHGTWYFHCSATNLLGRPERVRRGGYPSQAAARRAREEWLTTTDADRTAQGWTVQRWLPYWLDNRTKIRPTTRFHYARDIDNILIPYLGHYRLADLDARLLRTVFAQIAATTNSRGRPQSATAMQHLRTTLRAALNLAV